MGDLMDRLLLQQLPSLHCFGYTREAPGRDHGPSQAL